MSGLETGAGLLCPGLMTLVGFGGMSSPPRGQVGTLCSDRASTQPPLSSLADAQDAGKAPCLMLAWPGGQPPLGLRLTAAGLQGRGNKRGEHLNGTPLSILRAVSASQALILLLSKEARPEDGRVGPSPSRRGLSSLPQDSDPGGWRPCLGLRLPSCVRVLSCCACRLWSGEQGVASGRR